MQVFDSVEDAITYLNDQITQAEGQVRRYKELVQNWQPGDLSRKRDLVSAVSYFEGLRNGLRDAVRALESIKPGLIAAFESGKVKLRLPEGLGAEQDAR